MQIWRERKARGERAFRVAVSISTPMSLSLISWLIDRVDHCSVVMTDQVYSASGLAGRACFPAVVDSAGFAES